MKKITLKELKKQYESICNEYVNRFCAKQDMTFEYWIGNEVGGIAYINDFYFDFHDIKLDIDHKEPKGNIIDWYYSNIESFEKKSLNYFTYIKGLRISNLK